MNLLRIGVVVGLSLSVGLASTMGCSSSSTTSSSSGGASSTSSSSGDGGGSSSSSSSSSSSGGFKDCSGETSSGGQSKCTQAELDTYSNCTQNNCQTEAKACYGDSYLSGSFGGSCGPYITCTQKCECNDTACFQACASSLDQNCQTCQTTYGTCINQKCPAPSCMTGGSGKTCADLEACCAKIPSGQDKSTCETVYNSVKSQGDATCDAIYQQYAAKCP